MKKFYKIINSEGWVLSNQYVIACERLLGYGGVWTKDHRKAKRFATMKDCQLEVNKMPCGKHTKFLVVSNQDNWKMAYKIHKKERRIIMAIKVNGRTYWYVDTICVDEIIYDIYEDDYGNHIYRVSDTLY